MRPLDLAKGLGLGIFLFLTGAQAQIQNGSFEDGLNGWKAESGADLSSFPGSGSPHAALVGSGVTPHATLSQQFPVTSGLQDVHFDMTVLSGKKATLRVELQTTTAGRLGSALFSVTTQETGSSNWAHQTATFYVPEGVTAAVLRFIDESPREGIVIHPMIDLVKVVPSPLPFGIVNGSFEDDLAGWQVNKSEGIGISDEPPGYESLHRATLGGGNVPDCQLSQAFGLTNGTYELRMEWAIQGDKGRTGQIEVWITSSRGEILATRYFNGPALKPVLWETVKVPFTLPEGDTAVVTLMDRSPGSGIAVDPLVDNVRIVPVVNPPRSVPPTTRKP